MLKNKIAVITGASQGIGFAIAKKYVENGAKVINYSIVPSEKVVEGIEFYKGDVTDRAQIKEFYEYVKNKYGKIDILVNNAGVTKDALMSKMTEDMWDFVINVNLKGVFNMAQSASEIFTEQGFGNIVNISSIVGEYGNVGQTNYAATKSGVIGMTKTWAKELTRKGAIIRVNAIAPGYVNTEMMKTVPDKVLDPIRQKSLLKRLGEPEEIANAALFLGSDMSSYVTGHVLSVNGGLVI